MTLILSGTDGLSDVDGSAATPAIRGTDANTGIFFPAADTIAFSEGGVESMRIDSSGNVGIGTSSPEAILTVSKSSAGGEGGYLYLDNPSASTANSKAGIKFSTSSGGSFASTPTGEITNVITDASSAASALTFGTFNGSSSGERMRLDSSGNLCLNTTGYNNGKIVRVDDADGRVRSMIVNNNNAGSSSRCGYVVNAYGNSWAMEMGSSAANSNALNWTVDVFGSPVVRMALTTGGTATNSTGTWGTISDARLKENIIDASPKLGNLMQLRVVNYNLKSDPDIKMLGFVAQEIEQVFPNMVEASGDLTEDGDRYKSVKTTVLIPMLIKALQEQQAIITQLQADVASLQAPQGTP